jgi:hypothetical protein
MKSTTLLLVSAFCLFTSSLFAQKKASPAAPKVPVIKFCNADADTAKTNKMNLASLQEWSNGAKVMVKCSDGKTYQLHQFGIQVIVKNPMEVKDFGLGLDGFPIMAKKSIAKLLAGDTVIMGNVIGYDDKQSEIKLPGFSIAITE